MLRFTRANPGLATALTFTAILATSGLGAPARADAPAIVIPSGSDPENLFEWVDDGKEVAWLGVMLEEETESADGGARITGVVDDSPAQKAGLREGDVVVHFDGDAVRGPAGLAKRVRAREPGDRVDVVVVRDGAERTVEVELGERSGSVGLHLHGLGEHVRRSVERALEGLDLEDLPEHVEEALVEVHECENDDCRHHRWQRTRGPVLGVGLATTTAELRRHFGGDDDAGVLVSKVYPDTPAEQAGIRVGDLIVAVDGTPVAGAFAIRRAIRDKAGEVVTVELMREGSRVSVEVAFPDAGN